MSKKLIRDAFGDVIPQVKNEDGSFTVLSNGDITGVDFSKYKLLRDAMGDVLPYQYFDVEQNKFVAGVLGGDVKADQLAFNGPSDMESTNVQDAIIESFQHGDSIKRRLVTMLSQIDDNMPVWEGSTWEEIFDELPYIQSGREVGGAYSSVVTESFYYGTGTNAMSCYVVQGRYNFGSIPTKIIIQGNAINGDLYYTVFDYDHFSSVITYWGIDETSVGTSYRLKTGTNNCYVTENEFRLPYMRSNTPVRWVAYRT